MYIAKKTIKNIKQQFKRENDIGFIVHKSDKETPERQAFISQLYNNKSFVPTYTENYEKYKDSARDTIRKFSSHDWFCVSFVTLIFGGMALYFSLNLESQPRPGHITKAIQKHNKVSNIVLFTLLGLLAGFGIGLGSQILLVEETKDTNNSNLFSRLCIRLFDLMHEENPELDEKALKACNPEMARVIKALVIANIPESDVNEIQMIADNVAKQLRNMTEVTENTVLLSCNEQIKTALSIIEQNLITNQQLYDVILNVYRGKIPAQFKLQNSQKSR